MKHVTFFIALFNLFTFLSYSQTNPNRIPKPPAEKLDIFKPYFGKYTHSMEYAGIRWNGTMEVKPIIKGWYVDWTILTTSEDKKIDREYHMLVTWDSTLNKYRVWRFETLPPLHPSIEISLKTEGQDLIIEFPQTGRDGKPGIFYNKYSKTDDNHIKIVTEWHDSTGAKLFDIGVTIAERVK